MVSFAITEPKEPYPGAEKQNTGGYEAARVHLFTEYFYIIQQTHMLHHLLPHD